MNLFNSLIDKKEGHILDLFTGYILLFYFNEEEWAIECFTNEYILKIKNEIQENIDQLNETQNYIYLGQLKEIYGKELPGYLIHIPEHYINSILKNEFPEGVEYNSDNFKKKLASLPAKYHFIEIDEIKNTIKIKGTLPYVTYWLKVKSDIYEFVNFALESLISKNPKINSQSHPTGLKRILKPEQLDNLYNQFNHNPYRAVLVALDIVLSKIDEISGSNDLIKFISHYLDKTSNLNILSKLVEKIDIKDPETQLFYNAIRDVLGNFTPFNFFPDDYLKIREFFGQSNSSIGLILVEAQLKGIITSKELKEFKYANDGLIELYKIAEKDNELLSFFKEHLQLKYRNVILETCIFPLDPMLNSNLDNQISSKKETVNQTNNFFTIPNLSFTKYEVQFFDYLENFKFNIENGRYVGTYTEFDQNLYNLNTQFKNEIIQNITAMASVDREFYFNRIENRLKSTIDEIYAVDKEGNLIDLGLNLEIENKSVIIEPGEINNYLQIIKPHKSQIVAIIAALRNSIETVSNNKNKAEGFSNGKFETLSLFPGKDLRLLTIKEIIFCKCAKKQEPDDIWLSRFINDKSELQPLFPSGKGAGSKGNEFTEAKISQAALMDIIRLKLKESGCIGTASKLYFITKWGIDKHDTFISNRSEKESFAKAKNQFKELLQ